jgi:hypothetical protein
MLLRLHSVWLRRLKRDFARNAMNLDFVPCFSSHLNRSRRLIDASPGVVGLIKFRICTS